MVSPVLRVPDHPISPLYHEFDDEIMFRRLEPNTYWFRRLPSPTVPAKSRVDKAFKNQRGSAQSVRKQVSFATPTIQSGSRDHEYTYLSDEEVASLWWTAREYKAIVKSYKKTVVHMNQRVGFNPAKESIKAYWGLECKLHDASAKRRLRKEAVVRSVLLSQDFQRREGINDPIYIGEISSECSRNCRKEALERAGRDLQDRRRRC